MKLDLYNSLTRKKSEFSPVQPGKGLNRPDAGEDLVHVHRVHQRLVVSGLELVSADEETVGVLLDLVGNLAGRKAIERSLAHFDATKIIIP